MAATQRDMPAVTKFALPLLLLLSGFCGISYEILYGKLLGNLLGSQFTINATVLLTFLLGIGCGTLSAWRFGRFLWLIEAGIGLYAATLSLLYDRIASFLYSVLPWLGTNVYAAALTAFVLLLAPAFLIGCSVPLFASYLTSLRATHVFSITYGVYNVGAALTALVMEFVLLRRVGIRGSTLLLAGLNLIVALGLLALVRSSPLIPRPTGDSRRFPGRVLTALAIASVGSAVFQLLMMKIAEFIFGPYNETFSLVLATVLLGLALGSLAAGRFGLTFDGALLMSLCGLAGILAFLPRVISLYASLYPQTVTNYPLLVLLKLGVVFGLMALGSIGFGATIPALLRSYHDVARESGRLLFFSSVANALGFVLMAFVLHRYLDYGPILLTIAALTAVAVLVHAGPRRRTAWAALVLVGVSWASYRAGWDEMLLYRGHTNFHALMQPKEGQVTAHERFKGPQDVFAITEQNGRPYFFINGYVSIPLSNASEKIVAALSAMIAPRLDDALVLGVGSGATAGTVSLLFEHVDAVEINKVVLDNLFRMREYNFDIEKRESLTIHHDDGIHFLRTTENQYSLILNTVTTPLYFSSSKLYTRDLFDLAVKHLTPDGVYMTWIDVEIGDGGLNIILQSLAESFDECWLHVIKNDYFLLGCSNETIRIRNYDAVAAEPTLRRYLAEEHGLELAQLPYNLISTDALALKEAGRFPINTLDFPVLEFEMAQLQADRLTRFKERLDRQLDLAAVRDAVSAAMTWDAAEFRINVDMRLSPRMTLSRLLTKHLDDEFGPDERGIEEAARRLVNGFDSARARWLFGGSMLRRRHYGAAAVALEGAFALDPSIVQIRYDLADAYLGQERFDEALEQLVAEWELSRLERVPIRAAKALIRLERHAEALEWLDRAATVAGEEGAPERIGYYRGVVYEGLGDGERAERAYGEALAADADSERARRALERLRAGAVR